MRRAVAHYTYHTSIPNGASLSRSIFRCAEFVHRSRSSFFPLFVVHPSRRVHFRNSQQLTATPVCAQSTTATTMSSSKVIIVTGASRGIGLAIAQHLLKESHKVVLAARSKDQLEALKAAHPGQVEYIAGDLGDLKTIPKIAEAAVKTFGKIDGIVINHGVLEPVTRLADSSIEEWKKAYDINVFSGLALVQASLQELRKSQGCVLWVSSGAATGAYAAWGAYGTSKAAMNHLSAHLAVEEPDITSIAISPGRVDTAMQKVIRDAGGGHMAEKDHSSFVSAFDKGELFKPEQPGNIMARFVVNPEHNLSGKFIKWQAGELSAYQDA
ncbi:Putative short-chain dehydrogenase/reductase SDR, NAD(P)-binding domain superfamily [Colletotrichum destructivum]|uniref:Short-chain dehydrogenase/reductase SDR, NAD(P)-binding domain superfamily n=1 Tax=Colletotrichum destructivum TaxID=34406 RepID=A0AAX4II75_9PEZI|nr:Putative short-chain dehydrogenase/reductase SDR, NAD(P)-binding domain superfamily [Colletotrichum destructivum]